MQLPNFKNAHILIVGDVLLDSYWQGDSHRVSPEAPVPIVKVDNQYHRLGGAANVALNVKSLGAQVTLLGVVGEDETALRLKEMLNLEGINYELQATHNKPTINKLRVISHQQQLLRMDFEESFATLDKTPLVEKFKTLLQDVSLVVLSDYNKGTLSELEQTYIQLAKAANVPVLVDPKGRDFSKYQGATVITPNQKEFCEAFGAFSTCPKDKALEAIKEHAFEHILMTCGADGMKLISETGTMETLPTQAYEVRDVTGAGDTVIAAFAVAYACGLSPCDAMNLANMAAGIVVTKLGTATVSEAELLTAISQIDSRRGILSTKHLVELCRAQKALGQQIVMTNGCFDILHPGHIHYLEAAKQLGDKLIVAINTDASVKRNKGDSRPFKPLKDRMEILAALSSVDWVCSFDEDTPMALIKAIQPDVLAKGVDYKDVADVVGGTYVLGYGGKVEMIGPPKQWSTTEILEKMAVLEPEA